MTGEKGFTVLEVMICLAILAGVVVTVLASLNHHLGLVSYNRDLVTATILGKEKAEEVALHGLPRLRKGGFAGADERFSWRLDTEETEFKGLKRIDISVEWEGDRRVSFISYFQDKR